MINERPVQFDLCLVLLSVLQWINELEAAQQVLFNLAPLLIDFLSLLFLLLLSQFVVSLARSGSLLKVLPFCFDVVRLALLTQVQ